MARSFERLAARLQRRGLAAGAAFLVAATQAACGGGGSGPSTGTTGTLTQGQVAFAAQRLTADELATAQQARGLLADPATTAFIDTLIAGQKSAQDDLAAVVARMRDGLSPSDASRQLDEWSTAFATWLDQQGVGFDVPYLERQAEDLHNLLRFIDEVLIPNTTDPELLAALEGLRGSIAEVLGPTPDAGTASTSPATTPPATTPPTAPDAGGGSSGKAGRPPGFGGLPFPRLRHTYNQVSGGFGEREGPPLREK